MGEMVDREGKVTGLICKITEKDEISVGEGTFEKDSH